ncbi:MAG: sortase [Anaerolineaceae bacterium]
MKNQIKHSHTLSILLRSGLILALLLCGLPVQAVRAAGTLTVNSTADSGAGSLRQAISDAGAGDTINFASSLSGATILLASKLTLSKNVTIDGSSLSEAVIISGNDKVQVFHINSGVTSVLNSLTIANGGYTGTYSGEGGGGIFNAGTLTITNSTITGNKVHSYPGGGIYIDSGTLTLKNSTCSYNIASQAVGGCLKGSGVLTIDNSTISDNLTYQNGGGIFFEGEFTMTNSRVVSNTSNGGSPGDGGGGIFLMGNQQKTITNSTIADNWANFDGGGISIHGPTIINGCTFSGNRVATKSGGGIYKDMDSTFTITNSTFMNNIANNGGAISTPVGTSNASTVTNATFYNNTAFIFGDNFYSNNNTRLTLANSIIYNGDCSYDVGTGISIIDGGNNLENGNKCGLQTTKGSLINTNPQMGEITGSPAYITLRANSPAINGVTYNAPNNCPATDQRGAARPQGSACDIGAYEYPADTTAPAVASFSAASPSSSLEVTITDFSGTDNVAVTGYLITESTTPPSAGASGWSGTAPSTYTVTADGSHTLYPWVKDGANNVSAVYSAPATVVVNTYVASPEIDIQGNSISIASGDTTPALADGTNFGPVLLAANTTKTFTIKNTGDASLTLSGASPVQVSGANASDFDVSVQPTSPVAAGGSTTFTVRFTPSAFGTRLASVSVFNGDSNENPYTFAIQGAGANAPTVVTNEVTSFTAKTATLSGSVNPNSQSTTVSFQYGETTAYGKTVAASQSPLTGSSASDVSADISGLVPLTLYHVRVVAVNATGTTYGEDKTFTTPGSAPDVVTKAATAISNTGATFNGVVNANNNDTQYSFDYGLDTTYGTTLSDSLTNVTGTSDTAVSFAVSGLTPNTTYHYRINAHNDYGTTHGEDVQVTVRSVPEIEVLGLSQVIASGDTTPSSTDGTDFGFVAPAASTTRTFTIQNTGTSGLNLSGTPLVQVSGTAASDFTVSTLPVSPVAAAGSTTFIVTFTPSADGLRQGTLSIANDDSDEAPYTFALQGNASNMPEVVFGGNTFPNTNAILSTGIDYITLEFSMDVKSTADAKSANLPANYLLFSDGGDGFQTVDCAGGVAATDVNIPINKVFYDNHGGSGPFLANLIFNNATLLPAGKYRLLVCGTTSIENLAGIELNNGADSTLEFSVTESANPTPSPTQQSNSNTGGNEGTKTEVKTSELPATGFAPGRITNLLPQSAAAYKDTTLTLIIPKLDVKVAIVGVPHTDSGWDVSWLGMNAGYLEGTAYPTWAGNTVLTGHVWDAMNQPGPFAKVKDLRYGDQVQIKYGNYLYTYEVRENMSISPDDIQEAMIHKEKDWVTLLTCEDFNELTGEYSARRIVRAVLVSVK